MISLFPSSRLLILSYFVVIILIGAWLLFLPSAWNGDGEISYIDALFTSTSAVCVTGLITVNTAYFSLFGQVVIMALIQFGGLGIITFSTLYLTGSKRRISFARRKIIKDYFIETVEHDPKRIIRNIIILTFGMELIGMLVLLGAFQEAEVENVVFAAAFHAVSAFCNAGFSTFPDSLEGFTVNPAILITITLLLIVGGIGFVVVQDIVKKTSNPKLQLSLHSKIVLSSTGLLLAIGFFIYFILEANHSMKGMGLGERVVNSILQSATPRTAGFNSVSQSELSLPSRTFTIMLMFIGGAPGSIAGGVKVTTFTILILVVFKGVDPNNEMRIFNRKIKSEGLIKTQGFALKAFLMLISSIIFLTFTEVYFGRHDIAFFELLFESVSAFGTVGLSMGATPGLTSAGKAVIILTMLTGRVGLVMLAMAGPGPSMRRTIDYPHEEVLIG